MFQVGQQVKVLNDRFYGGRAAFIKDAEDFGHIRVYTVAVPSATGNATITFALTDKEMELV